MSVTTVEAVPGPTRRCVLPARCTRRPTSCRCWPSSTRQTRSPSEARFCVARARTPRSSPNGASSVTAALNMGSGKVIGSLKQRHRAQEFKSFLVQIDTEVPDELDVHLILDNYATHKTPDIQRWLLRHPRFHLHFTPTSGSWLDMVERWFGELTTKKIKRGAHMSVRALENDIREWIATWNEDPRPHVWVKTADQILASLARYSERVSAAASGAQDA